MEEVWTVKLPAYIRPLAEQIAIAEDRTATGAVRHLLIVALEQRGLLKRKACHSRKLHPYGFARFGRISA
jgi:hypothetical protein